VQILVLSSPGPVASPHWSKDAAEEFCGFAAGRGADVRWLVPLYEEEEPPVRRDRVEVATFRAARGRPLHAVAASQLDPALERALSESARAAPGCAVVHFGLGAHGSPNLLWLAERLGSRTFASVRGSEVVCHRGDLRDRSRESCREWSDAERCRWCCTTSWWRRPRANDLRNRADLLVAGLLSCEAIAAPSTRDASLVTELGVPSDRLRVGASAAELHAIVTGAPAA